MISYRLTKRHLVLSKNDSWVFFTEYITTAMLKARLLSPGINAGRGKEKLMINDFKSEFIRVYQRKSEIIRVYQSLSEKVRDNQSLGTQTGSVVFT